MRVALKKISNQVIVLTGATSGIGLATARMAARRRAKLVLVARNADALKQLKDELECKDAEVLDVVADVGSEAQVQRIAQAAIAHFGRIDTWINNAGVSIYGRLEEVTTDDKRRLFETNFWGMVYGSLAAVQCMKLQGGALINIGSAFSDRAAPLQSIYSASKHAVKGFTDSLRVELEEEDIPVSVTLIKPSAINTMLTEHAKNYLEVRPRLPPPVYAPQVVAKSILHAAEHPVRDLYAGGAAKLLALSAYSMPRLVDWIMRLVIFRLQKTHKPPYPESRHNLHGPAADMKERSPIDAHVFERSLYTDAAIHIRTHPTRYLGAALVLIVLWKFRPAVLAR
jgi:short-subunit dehydrogenase